MKQSEYREIFEELLKHSEKYVCGCSLTGSLDRLKSGQGDPHFLTDYRNYAFTKSTKSLKSVIALLELGNYEDALILTRSNLECYLSARYFDENYSLTILENMVLTPMEISEGNYVHKNGEVLRRDTREVVDYHQISPAEMSLGKDKTYFYQLYYALCEITHCNVSQIYRFLDENRHFTLTPGKDNELPYLASLFVFCKLFESIPLLESVRFSDEEEEQACAGLLVRATEFLFRRLSFFGDCYQSGNEAADKEFRQLFRHMRSSLREQLGRVEKDFVEDLEKQFMETNLETILKPELLRAERPSAYFMDQKERGKLPGRFPEIHKLIGIPQNPEYHPEGDVFVHTMEVLDRAAACREQVRDPYGFMLLALTHDLGKIIATKEENGKIRSIGHENELLYVKKCLNRITKNQEVIDYVLGMIPWHMKTILYAKDRSAEKATDKLFAECPSPEDLILFAACDKPAIPEADLAFLRERLQGFRERQQADRNRQKEAADA